jgi:adenine C2-methylase RlmN of 23S rRNA A2503 and tRNA A37
MMGMGEPLANYDSVRAALGVFLDDRRLRPVAAPP